MMQTYYDDKGDAILADFDRGTGLDGNDNYDDEMMSMTTTMAMTRQ